MTKPVIELIMDSGAFSAFTKGRVIDISKYCDFCLANQEYISTVVNLDVINPQGPEIAAEAGWNNFLYMQDRGILPMPVYHAREEVKWLDKMLDSCKYIGLSGTSLVSPLEAKAFYDLSWHYCTDSAGNPIANFHAFGDTAAYSMLTYPWYSADSATWMIQAGRAARVKLQGRSYQLRSSSIRDSSFIALDDPPIKRAAWEEEIRLLGLNPDAVMNVKASQSELAMIRSYLVAADTIKLQAQAATVNQFKKPLSLLSMKRGDIGTPSNGVKISFVLSPSAYYFNLPIVAALGIKHVLLSYYYVETAPKKFWHERLTPFLFDPVGFCNRDPKIKKYFDKLNEVLLNPIQEAVLV